MNNTILKGFALSIVFVLGSHVTVAQTTNERIHHEVEEDPFVAVDKSVMPRTPAYTVRNTTFFTTQVNVDSNGDNIVGDAANEPSIAVDPTNPDRIVIGWRQFDTTASNFRQAGYGYSLDGGQTFTFPGVIDPGVFRSDPVLDFDAEGNLYYNSLQSTFDCDVYTIDDGGVVWGPAAPARGGDKQWMRIDRTGGIGNQNNYSSWSEFATTCAPGIFTRSTDGSQTFEDCVSIPNLPRWGTLAVDANGVLFIVGTSTSGPIVVKSNTAQDPGITPVSFESPITVDLDGDLNGFVSVNPSGLLGQAWIDVDISNGPGAGNVYVAASVSRFSNGDVGDVMFARSTDGGETFEAPVRINTDSGTSAVQWFGTMSVAPNGRIDIVWLDTRNAPAGTVDSELYYTFSDDQGTTWADEEVLSASFDPTIGYPQQNKMGDYFDMVSDNRGAHLAWANTLNGGQDVYYTFIDPNSVLSANDVNLADVLSFSAVPNPFNSSLNLQFKVENASLTTVEVFDILGRKQATLLDEVAEGPQQLSWDANNGGTKIASGIYFVRVQVGSSTQTFKVVKE